MRGVVKTVSRAALTHNWRLIRRRARARSVLAVLKSDAYGHGLLTVAEALADVADGFAVVDPQDAIGLRARGVRRPILLLQGVFCEAQCEALAAHDLWTTAHCAWQIKALRQLSGAARVRVFLKINTGMNRLGFAPCDAAAALAALRQTPAVESVALMTHFAAAEQPDELRRQLGALAPLRAHNLPLSLGNSAATLLAPDIGDDVARVGIALYGASPAPEAATAAALGLRPAMTFAAPLLSVRDIGAEQRVGYGGEFAAPAPMRMGVAGAGYGDGYPRRQGLHAMLRGARAPLIGRVSMEMLALDLRACPQAAPGDMATLWGEAPAVDDVAAAAGTIAYDLLTGARGEQAAE